MASIIRGPGFAILADRPLQRAGPLLNSHVDGFLSESHELRLSKTTYPLESGKLLTDHAVVEPKTLKLVGWVSGLLAPEHRRAGYGSYGSGAEAWGEIVTLAESREPVKVVTMLGVYDSMLITSVKAPVDRTTGRALRFEMELEEVLFRALERGARPPLERIGPAKDRPEETDFRRVIASDLPGDDILADLSAQQPDGPSDEPSFWDRTLTTIGRSVSTSIRRFLR